MTTGKIQFPAMKKWLVLLLLIFMNCRVYAVPTKQLSYQGRLNNAGGQPVPDGTYTIVFSIYNAASGGAALWTETQNVNVANGGFSVYLGSVTAITLPFNEDYFLGLKVASDPEMTPRLKLSVVGASAYSLEAEKLQGKAASDFALATHTHTGLSATTVNGYSVSATPTASTLLPLDSGAKFPASVLPAITDAEISATAAIAKSKLAALNISDSDVSSISASKINTSGATNLVTQIVAGTNVTVSPAGGTGVVTINATPVTGFVQLTPSSAQTMQATADVTPLIIKDDTAGTTANLFDVQDSAGTSLVKVNGAGNLLVGNPTTTSPKVSLLGTGTVFYSESAGTSGYAGRFNTTNSSNANEALNASTSGAGAGIWISQTGTGKGLILETNNASNANSLIYGNIVTGTGNLMQLLSGGTTKFVVTNSGNLLVGNPTVTTAKLSVEETGTNYGGYIQTTNASNTNSALLVKSNATSGAATFSAQSTGGTAASYFSINNASNAQTLISGDIVSGTGNILQLQKGGANQVVVNNSGNLLVGNPTTTTAKVSAEETGTANNAGNFSINNASSTKTALAGVIISGGGRAGMFWVTSATGAGTASFAQTDGTGMAGQFVINNASNASPLIVGTTTGTGTGLAVTINNAANASSIFSGNTTGTGNLLQLQQSGASQLVVANNGKLSFSTGANKAVGTGTIAAATNSITIANTSVTAGSLIFLTINNTTGTVTMPLKVGTITAGVSFVVDTGDATNAPAGGINFNYLIVN